MRATLSWVVLPKASPNQETISFFTHVSRRSEANLTKAPEALRKP